MPHLLLSLKEGTFNVTVANSLGICWQLQEGKKFKEWMLN